MEDGCVCGEMRKEKLILESCGIHDVIVHSGFFFFLDNFVLTFIEGIRARAVQGLQSDILLSFLKTANITNLEDFYTYM